METKPLTEEAIADVKPIVRERFGDAALGLFDKIMRNPLRRECLEAGDIIYENGQAICFQAAILREVYYGGEHARGIVGGMTCLRAGASPEAMIDLRAASNKSRGGSRWGFGNSCNEKSAAIVRKLKTRHPGPDSCTRYLWRAIRPLECALYYVRRKIFKGAMPKWKSFGKLPDIAWDEECGGVRIRRVREATPEFFDALMTRYLKTNQGLVCSRTAEEIDWIFGEWIRTGEVIVLGAFDGEGPAGYILLKTDVFAKRWKIHDWFAVGNRADILEPLLATACRFLKKMTPAMMLEVEGFPTWVQPMLKKYLPHIRPIGFNQFSWGSRDKEFKAKVMPIIDSPKSWFFGPYDGDECM